MLKQYEINWRGLRVLCNHMAANYEACSVPVSVSVAFIDRNPTLLLQLLHPGIVHLSILLHLRAS